GSGAGSGSGPMTVGPSSGDESSNPEGGSPVADAAVEGGTLAEGGDATTTVSMANPAPGSKFFIGANFWNIDWEGQGDFFVSNVDFTTTTNPWRPELLADLAPYKVLRFMDWNQTNDSNNP